MHFQLSVCSSSLSVSKLMMSAHNNEINQYIVNSHQFPVDLFVVFAGRQKLNYTRHFDEFSLMKIDIEIKID